MQKSHKSINFHHALWLTLTGSHLATHTQITAVKSSRRSSNYGLQYTYIIKYSQQFSAHDKFLQSLHSSPFGLKVGNVREEHNFGWIGDKQET